MYHIFRRSLAALTVLVFVMQLGGTPLQVSAAVAQSPEDICRGTNGTWNYDTNTCMTNTGGGGTVTETSVDANTRLLPANMFRYDIKSKRTYTGTKNCSIHMQLTEYDNPGYYGPYYLTKQPGTAFSFYMDFSTISWNGAHCALIFPTLNPTISYEDEYETCDRATNTCTTHTAMMTTTGTIWSPSGTGSTYTYTNANGSATSIVPNNPNVIHVYWPHIYPTAGTPGIYNWSYTFTGVGVKDLNTGETATWGATESNPTNGVLADQTGQTSLSQQHIGYFVYDPTAQVQVKTVGCPAPTKWTLTSPSAPSQPNVWPAGNPGETINGVDTQTIAVHPYGDGYTPDKYQSNSPGSDYSLIVAIPPQYDASITPAATQHIYATGSDHYMTNAATIYSVECTKKLLQKCPDGSEAPNGDTNQCVCSGATLTANPTQSDGPGKTTLTWGAATPNCESGALFGGTDYGTAGSAVATPQSGSTLTSLVNETTAYTYCAYNHNKSIKSCADATFTINSCSGSCCGTSCPPFAYTLSNSGTLTLNLDGNTNGVETIYKKLTSGSGRAVNLSLSGMPSWLTPSQGTGSNCAPDCSSDINFSLGSGAKVGQYPVTVTGSPNNVSTVFTVKIVKQFPVTCVPSSSSTHIGSPVTYTATPQGGTAPYSYSWSGSEISGSKSGNPLSMTYQTIGQKTATVSVTDADGGSGTCIATTRADFSSTFQEF